MPLKRAAFEIWKRSKRYVVDYQLGENKGAWNIRVLLNGEVILSKTVTSFRNRPCETHASNCIKEATKKGTENDT